MLAMASTRPPLDLGILMLLACQEFVRDLRTYVAEQGFAEQGRSDGFVLRVLDVAPMTVSELAERLEITKQGAGQIVDDMERRGYLQRRPDPRDGRARLLHLSDLGSQVLAAARRFHHAYERRLVRDHGAEAVATFRTLLTAMAGAQQAADPRLRALYL